MVPDFEVVCGVDAAHIEQFQNTYKTWEKNKPSLLKRRLVIFYDVAGMTFEQIERMHSIPAPRHLVHYVPWRYPSDRLLNGVGRFFHPQRQRMLAGFIYVTAEHVRAPYWLKLDLDAVAHDNDEWVNPEWFQDRPAIIAPPWGYTKPANQMDILDEWSTNFPDVFQTPQLKIPATGETMLHHPRISSWCAFFETSFTQVAASLVDRGLPVPSQDGFHWYIATRLSRTIRRVPMKNCGWAVYGRKTSLDEALRRALC